MKFWIMKRLSIALVMGMALVINQGGFARAATIDAIVIDDNTLNVAFSGQLMGPAPDRNLNILFVDVSVLSNVSSGATIGGVGSIVGDLFIGSNLVTAAYSGYNNIPYGGSFQLRTNVDNIVGAVLSGSAILNFNVPHGLTQSMFDSGNAPVHWGRRGTTANIKGTPQFPQTVPAPASGFLSFLTVIGLLGGAVWRKRSHAPSSLPFTAA
ncbi:hypothetical protein [uncultured Roseovarius sp.]|uniref:hypothetical protein n=1 Tax=uncultured Roseovarius sp. TaxID=293344 RepID=UPI00259998E3|nr:hypothetical protein [uncultured Roseovarius sp.]